MCGIAGFIAPDLNGARASQVLDDITDAIGHRGPDSRGTATDTDGIRLGHRRLAILDITPSGHQPMIARSGRYHIVFNGEIYNYRELKAELIAAGHVFNGTSDTEVMLAAFDQYGVQAAVGLFVGMFAFAVWDRIDRHLWLGRDRMGEKPLYYLAKQGVFAFASELKALARFPSFDDAIDKEAVALFFRFSYVPSPRTIYRACRKLDPGCVLRVAPDGESNPTVIRYWSAMDTAATGARSPFRGSAEEAADELERLLSRSVAAQMVSDVPVGAFLSGGIDSSTVVAMMARQSRIPPKTFTIAFDIPGYNEAPYAAEIARHLGTDHVEHRVTPEDALAVIPLLPRIYDEPFSDSSQIPTYLVSKVARGHVTVALSGDGGDELFAGYTRYAACDWMWRRLSRIPRSARAAVARRIDRISSRRWKHWGSLFEYAIRRPGLRLGDRIQKMSHLLRASEPSRLYDRMTSHWLDEQIVGLPAPVADPSDAIELDFVSQMMLRDQLGYLPDDILVKVDRAAMSVSLETRAPLLDHRVVEFAWTLPPSYRIKHNKQKWPLRAVLSRYVPSRLYERPKMGFGVPIAEWLRGPLRDWAESLLDRSAMESVGINSTIVRRKWTEHVSGARNWAYHLWDVLMFQAWLRASRAPLVCR